MDENLKKNLHTFEIIAAVTLLLISVASFFPKPGITGFVSVETKKQKIESEYQAELFSIRLMKKYYSKQYRLLLKRFKDIKRMEYYKNNEPIYYKAFSKIKDYKETEWFGY